MPFLQGRKEWIVFLGILFCIFLSGMAWRYYQFLQIPHTPFELKAKVLAQYPKNGKTILKLKSNSQIFYTSSKENLKDLSHKSLLLYGKVLDCDFLQSLRSCYFVSYSISTLPRSVFEIPYEYVSTQHKSIEVGKLFESLFFASFLPKEWREIASALHISHLIAISGLHLGILIWVLYGILARPYMWLQQRFFPYRNRIFDMGVISAFVLLGYMIFIGTPPAFLRAYVMSMMALGFVYTYAKVMSFSFLGICALMILAFFPQLAGNVGFWFSILGVFYIFLFFHHFPYKHQRLQWLKVALLLNSVLFFQMLPIVHFVFGAFSLFAFLCIPLSVIFPLWFVVMIALHCLGIGGVGDRVLEWVLEQKIEVFEIFTPLWFLLLYLAISFLAIKDKRAYYASLGLGVVFWGFMIIKTAYF